jgi:hypothetical protein
VWIYESLGSNEGVGEIMGIIGVIGLIGVLFGNQYYWASRSLVNIILSSQYLSLSTITYNAKKTTEEFKCQEIDDLHLIEKLRRGRTTSFALSINDQTYSLRAYDKNTKKQRQVFKEIHAYWSFYHNFDSL